MAVTDLRRVRLQIADLPRRVIREQIGVGDGYVTKFQAQLWPILELIDAVVILSTVSVRIAGVETVKVRVDDYDIELGAGVVTFVVAPVADAQVFAAYYWAVFTDGDLNDLLSRNGDNVTLAAMGAIQWLLADSDRFIKYTFGQETVDRTASRKGLLDLYAMLRGRLGAPVGLVKARSDDREELMAPFIEQAEALQDVTG